MNLQSAAEQCLRDKDPKGALQQLQEAVRAKPGDSKLRIFLFQLLSVLGQWERALNQLNVAAELDPAALAMAQMYREALHCEVLRTQVFEGKKSPMVFGQPDQWLALLIESLLLSGQGKYREAEHIAHQGIRGGEHNQRCYRRSAVRMDRRCGQPPGTGMRGHHQWPLLLVAIFSPSRR